MEKKEAKKGRTEGWMEGRTEGRKGRKEFKRTTPSHF